MGTGKGVDVLCDVDLHSKAPEAKRCAGTSRFRT